MRLLTWDAGGADAWEAVGAAVGDVQPDVAFLPAVGPVPAAGVRTDRCGDGTVERVPFPGDHPLGDYHFYRRRAGDAAGPAILWRSDVAADVVAYPDGEPWSGVVGFGVPGRCGPSFFTVAADRGRGPCSRTTLEWLDERVGDPWLAAGTFDAPPATLRTRLRADGNHWGVCPPEAVEDVPGTDDSTGDRAADYLVWSRRAEPAGRVLRPGGTGTTDRRGVVYDVRGPEPVAVRCRDAGRWRAAHSPLASVAFDLGRVGSEAGRPESPRLVTDGGE